MSTMKTDDIRTCMRVAREHGINCGGALDDFAAYRGAVIELSALEADNAQLVEENLGLRTNELRLMTAVAALEADNARMRDALDGLCRAIEHGDENRYAIVVQAGRKALLPKIQAALSLTSSGMVCVSKERLSKLAGCAMHAFTSSPALIDAGGAGVLANVLGVDLITANEIANAYSDRSERPTAHEWCDMWLAALIGG